MNRMNHSSYSSCNLHSDMTFPAVDALSLAMAYVPWQQWQMIYTPEEALRRGTLFRQLDLPFEGGGCRK